MKLTKPTLLLDPQKATSNLDRMVEKARRNQCVLRPHFKTHQSHLIGEWFRERGIEQITVSSVTMAEYFARDGWKDITIAFPVNPAEIENINDLAQKVKLNILVESDDVVDLLIEKVSNPLGLFIKIDLGTHRTGVDPGNQSMLSILCKRIDGAENLKFQGFLGHAGHSYGARTPQEILDIHQEAREIMETLRKEYEKEYPGLIISVGDTPTCSVAEDFTWADEMRPGNFIFYDLMQSQIGSCKPNDIAVAMTCPVVAKHPDRNEIVIYGGGVHFSKDFIYNSDHSPVYGMAVEDMSTGWGQILEDVYLCRLSQEHGILHAPAEYIEKVKPGEFIKILPVHSCMTANLMKSFMTPGGHEIPMLGS